MKFVINLWGQVERFVSNLSKICKSDNRVQKITSFSSSKYLILSVSPLFLNKDHAQITILEKPLLKKNLFKKKIIFDPTSLSKLPNLIKSSLRKYFKSVINL